MNNEELMMTESMIKKETCFVGTNFVGGKYLKSNKGKTVAVIPSGEKDMPVWFVVKIKHHGGVNINPPVSIHLSLSSALKEAHEWIKKEENEEAINGR